MHARPIHLITALPAEAKPIAARFRLERAQPDQGYPIYRRGPVALAVTGPGKVDSAAATAMLGTLGGQGTRAIWVNLGIAGHSERSVGEVLLASSVRDGGSGRLWRPTLPRSTSCPSDALLTLDRPDLVYEHEGMVDMEASGFFPVACRFSDHALVQVLKVISDNRERTAHGLGAKQVRLLMGEILDPLEALLAHLQACADLCGEVLDESRAG
jgi:nucleoside phosphorylase